MNFYKNEPGRSKSYKGATLGNNVVAGYSHGPSPKRRTIGHRANKRLPEPENIKKKHRGFKR